MEFGQWCAIEERQRGTIRSARFDDDRFRIRHTDIVCDDRHSGGKQCVDDQLGEHRQYIHHSDLSRYSPCKDDSSVDDGPHGGHGDVVDVREQCEVEATFRNRAVDTVVIVGVIGSGQHEPEPELQQLADEFNYTNQLGKQWLDVSDGVGFEQRRFRHQLVATAGQDVTSIDAVDIRLVNAMQTVFGNSSDAMVDINGTSITMDDDTQREL